MSRTIKAMLLNALVLPGLGQLYVGRKVMGVAIIMLVNLLLLLALFVLLKGASPLIAATMTSGTISTDAVLTALNGVAGFGKPLLAAFLLVWGFALIDIFRHRADA